MERVFFSALLPDVWAEVTNDAIRHPTGLWLNDVALSESEEAGAVCALKIEVREHCRCKKGFTGARERT